MKILAIMLLASFAAGCEQNAIDHDARLQGKWFSDKKMTLKNIGETKLNEKGLQFLEKNLGDLGYAYKKNKMAVLFRSDPSLVPKFNEYELIKVTDNTVIIKSPGHPQAEYTFEGYCYFVETEWDYNEYFCKEN